MIKSIFNELDFYRVRPKINFYKYPSYSSLVSKILTIAVILLLLYTLYELSKPIINM